MRSAAARTDKAAARYRCEEGCGTMDQTPDHRSETAGPDRSKRSVVRVEVDRSKEIIERRVPRIVHARAGEKSPHHPSEAVRREFIRDEHVSGKPLFHGKRGRDGQPEVGNDGQMKVEKSRFVTDFACLFVAFEASPCVQLTDLTAAAPRMPNGDFVCPSIGLRCRPGRFSLNLAVYAVSMSSGIKQSYVASRNPSPLLQSRLEGRI